MRNALKYTNIFSKLCVAQKYATSFFLVPNKIFNVTFVKRMKCRSFERERRAGEDVGFQRIFIVCIKNIKRLSSPSINPTIFYFISNIRRRRRQSLFVSRFYDNIKEFSFSSENEREGDTKRKIVKKKLQDFVELLLKI